jgi:hypothetical protein
LGSTHSSLSTIFFVVLAFFLENGPGLPSTATLLPVITPFSLAIQGILALLALCHFVRLVLAALLAESPVGFRNVNHFSSSPQI